MNKALVAVYALLLALGASPSHASLSPREQASYEFGFEWGFLTAACMYYQQGSISSTTLFDAFATIDEDEEMTQQMKDTLFQNVHKSAQKEPQYVGPCSKQLRIFQRQRSSNNQVTY